MSDHASRLQVFDSNWQAVLLLFPTLVLISVFLYYPFLETVQLSFYRIRVLGNEQWVGFDHYLDLFGSDTYRNSLVVTVIFTVATVTVSLFLSLLLSFLVHETRRFTNVYLIGLIWPYALPLAVAAVVLDFLINPQLGIVTFLLNSTLGIEFNWTTDGTAALVAVILAAVWQGLGYSIIFMTAALGQIPESVTDAARLDGVGPLGRLFRVYVPLISPILVFLIVLQTIGAFFGGFALVDLMTGGGPDESTNVLMFNLYQDAFTNSRFGYAAAQSVVLFVFVAVLMYVQLKITDRYAYYGGV
jgi:sn-glycerol 3-phosphate transport system permease protein